MIHTLRQILQGTKEMDEHRKYQGISLMFALVHFMFVIMFYCVGVRTLFYYNIGVVAFYLLLIFIIEHQKRYTLIFISAFVEILVHSSMASLMLGFSLGFMNYTVALVPMSFYIGYTLPYIKKKLLVPLAFSLIVILTYFTVLFSYLKRGAYYADALSIKQQSVIFSFNSFLIFLFLGTVAFLFSVEVRFMQYHLEEENISLTKMANFDALTHLLNRRSMNIHLKQIMDEMELQEEDEPFCLIIADIDNFKKVNDTYGHSKGDEVLVEVANVLQSNVREMDKVCRWGGEEMLILLRSNMETARSVAQRICSDMAMTQIENGEDPISVTLTLGVSEYAPGETVRTLIETADQRLYRGKHSGKNCVVWN